MGDEPKEGIDILVLFEQLKQKCQELTQALRASSPAMELLTTTDRLCDQMVLETFPAEQIEKIIKDFTVFYEGLEFGTKIAVGHSIEKVIEHFKTIQKQ